MVDVSSQQDKAVPVSGDDRGKPADSEFASTQFDESAENLTALWSESTDGHCSENAALFAASQPAPLSVV